MSTESIQREEMERFNRLIARALAGNPWAQFDLIDGIRGDCIPFNNPQPTGRRRNWKSWGTFEDWKRFNMERGGKAVKRLIMNAGSGRNHSISHPKKASRCRQSGRTRSATENATMKGDAKRETRRKARRAFYGGGYIERVKDITSLHPFYQK